MTVGNFIESAKQTSREFISTIQVALSGNQQLHACIQISLFYLIVAQQWVSHPLDPGIVFLTKLVAATLSRGIQWL